MVKSDFRRIFDKRELSVVDCLCTPHSFFEQILPSNWFEASLSVAPPKTPTALTSLTNSLLWDGNSRIKSNPSHWLAQWNSEDMSVDSPVRAHSYTDNSSLRGFTVGSYSDRSLLSAPLSSGLSYCLVASATAARCVVKKKQNKKAGRLRHKPTQRSAAHEIYLMETHDIDSIISDGLIYPWQSSLLL